MAKDPLKILVTGGAGSGGSYMLEYLLQCHPEASYSALVRDHSSLNNGNLNSIQNNIEIEFCDLEDFNSVCRSLRKITPNQIYHFASYANVKQSFEEPVKFIKNNINGTVHLLEACRQICPDVKILLCSTSEVYGQVLPSEVPISESNPIRPASPYAISKTTQDLLGQVYFQSFKIPIIRTRMFTYINPRRRDLFATAFALQVAQIENGLQTELRHGNLQSVRTHLDIRDVVTAYYEAMNNGIAGEIYNIGGLQSYSVGEFLAELIKKAKVPIKAVLDENLLRPVDVTLQIPDISNFKKISNWQPKYSLEESINFLLNECRQQVLKKR